MRVAGHRPTISPSPRRVNFPRFAGLLAVTIIVWSTRPPTAPAQATGPVAFVGVNVVPMDRETVLTGQTVLVVDGVISAIGPAGSVALPDGVTSIDGSGQYLMPGLADLHVHVQNEADLPVYLLGGVTTVLDLGGRSRLLGWRDRLETGGLVGPHLLVSYFIDGPGGRFNVVETPEEARQVIRAAAGRYDYIKVYNSLTLAQFHAIMDEARIAGIPVVGHGVRRPGMQAILEGGQVMIAHGEEYIYTYFGNSTNRALIPSAVDLTKRTGAYVLPNLSAFEIMAVQWGRPFAVDSFLSQPEVRYLHPSYRESWRSGKYTSRNGSLRPRLIFLQELTRAFADANVPLLLGTDSPGIPGMFAGASIHNDLRNLIDAGLTPYQALSAGTRTAGAFVRQTIPGSPVFGVIAEGARADLVLLDDNPLESVTAARYPNGVMVGGDWWSADAMREMLDVLYGDLGSSTR